MTIKKLADVKAEILSLLLDNNAKLITPARVRTVTEDLLDSVTGGNAILDCTANTTNITVGTTPIPLIGVWNGPVRADTGMQANAALGRITGYSAEGYDHLFNLTCTLSGNDEVDVVLTLERNGVATQAIASGVLRGNNNPVTFDLLSLSQAQPAGVTYRVLIKADRNVTISMPRGFMRVQRLPT